MNFDSLLGETQEDYDEDDTDDDQDQQTQSNEANLPSLIKYNEQFEGKGKAKRREKEREKIIDMLSKIDNLQDIDK